MAVASVCVIGAGPSGLTSVKAMLAEGFDVTCLEAEAEIGGNWVFKDALGHASVYETTHIISSRKFSQFSDFPMPEDYPHYPSHTQVLAYFNAYADAFGLRDHIVLNCRVTRAAQADGGGWTVEWRGPDGNRSGRFDHLVVCSGHHWNPMTPQIAGNFPGRSLHSHDYRRAEPFRGQRVLVVGGGNSACDIAASVAGVAEVTHISMRSGQHIMPKMIFGHPSDHLYQKYGRLPRWLLRRMMRNGIRIAIGRYRNYGMVEPDTPVLSMHPTLNSEIFDRIMHGELSVQRGIETIEGDLVRFADGRSARYDTIIWATGYRADFPFLEKEMPNPVGETTVDLYLRMIPPRLMNIFFVGLIQPAGCIWTLAEQQARVAAAHAAGRLSVPGDVERLIADENAESRRMFKQGSRHAIAVGYHEYFAALKRVLSRQKPHPAGAISPVRAR